MLYIEDFSTVDVEESSEETSYIDNEVARISADGKISYETIPVTSEEISTYSNDDGIVILNDTSASLQSDDVMATASSTSLQNVSLFSVTQTPYKYMCLITAQFPNGDVAESSGILISKNMVLASAHGVYDHERGGAATKVHIGVGVYFSDSTRVYQGGIQNWNGAALKRGWIENELCKYDWSLIMLSQNVDSYQKCGYVPDYTKATGKDIQLIGYPGENKKGATSFKYSLGQITGTTDPLFMDKKYDGMWTLSADSAEGMSGGPIIEVSNGAVIGTFQGHRLLIGTTLSVPITKEAADTIQQYAVW